ncbi:M56 family metallopeptidase [Candidatus Allofournierella excrementavium]|uniref:M56 family metallopeptidase n=1 Tax=Candidatus Allofournierella excrementavium TaxID=2838591 RepID=UPI003AF736CE
MNELFYSLVLPLSAAGGLAVLACLALSPLLNKLRPAARTRALAAAFPLFLVPAGPVLALLFAAKPAPVAAPLAPVGRALDAAARAAQSAAPAVLPTQTAAPAATPDPAALVLAALPWVWAAGALACTLWQMGRYLRFCRGLQRLSAPVGGERDALWQEVCAQAGVACAPRLRACPGLAGPVMTGLVRPVLYLPEGMPLARLELTLRHEAAHLSRGDLWAKALVRWCCRLHWFNPLCALQEGRWSRACEYACDEKAAAGLGEADRRAYGLLLLDAAQSRPLPAGAAGLGGPKKEMKARLAALLHPAAPSRRLTVAVAAALIATLCLTVCVAAGFSTSDAPVSVPVSSASPQPLAGASASQSGNEADSVPPASQAQDAPDSASQSSASQSGAEADRVPPASQSTAKADDALQADGFIWPVPAYETVSRWKSDYHKGADLKAPYGSEVLAMAAGTVTMAQWHYSYGNVVEVDHGNGLSTLYAHLESMDVAVGDKVAQGQQIGTVGSTGNTTGVQCHVEVRQDGALLDLHDYFPDK